MVVRIQGIDANITDAVFVDGVIAIGKECIRRGRIEDPAVCIRSDQAAAKQDAWRILRLDAVCVATGGQGIDSDGESVGAAGDEYSVAAIIAGDTISNGNRYGAACRSLGVDGDSELLVGRDNMVHDPDGSRRPARWRKIDSDMVVIRGDHVRYEEAHRSGCGLDQDAVAGGPNTGIGEVSGDAVDHRQAGAGVEDDTVRAKPESVDVETAQRDRVESAGIDRNGVARGRLDARRADAVVD